MRYDDRDIDIPESELEVFRCDDWNGDSCYSNWEQIDSDIDTVRDNAKVSGSEIAAYVIGARKGIAIQAGTDKGEYNLYDTIELEGIASIDGDRALDKAYVSATIKGTSITRKGTTDEQGVFLIKLDAPEKEGDYDIEITVSKSPLSPLTIKKKITITKSRQLSISIPSGIKMETGSEKAVEFKLKNDGQSIINDISIMIKELPSGVTAVFGRDNIEALEPLEEALITINLSASGDSEGTYPLVVRAESEKDGIAAEKTFVLTSQSTVDSEAPASTSQGQDTPEPPDFSLIGNAIASAGASYGYLLLLLIICITFAYLMRNRRLTRIGERSWVKNLLNSVNQEITRSEMNKSKQSNKFKSFERVKSWSR
jgi:hypothetical protein